tara:strand:- start:2692 stop:2940 length:249 start_codon:yes stop_codon:yes gene_type:complete
MQTTNTLTEVVSIVDSLGESSLNLKSSIDRTVMGDDTSSFLTHLAELERQLKSLKTTIASGQKVPISDLETLIALQICKSNN